MAVTHTNRKGKTYFLQQGNTKTGRLRYFFTTQEGPAIVEHIPQGYEVYENPNSQVFLRRKQPEVITKEENELVEQAMVQYYQLEHFIVEIRKNAIYIYIPDQDVAQLKEMLDMFVQAKSRTRPDVEKFLSYSPTMQFVLIDEKLRLFQALRNDSHDQINNWIALGEPQELFRLVKKFIQHLGQAFYLELR